MPGFLDNTGFLAASNGTGNFTVSAGIVGYQLPVTAGAVDGIVYRYKAFSSNLTEWEIGYGAYTVSSTTLARTTVLSNSAGGTSKISFTAAPNVVVTFLSEDINPVVVSTLTELAKLDTTKTTLAFLSQTGREGLFSWQAGNYATVVAADTQNGIYKASAAVASSSGAWQRVFSPGEYNVKWFGAVGDNSTDDTAAIQACINYAESRAGGTVLFSMGGYFITSGLVVNTPLVRLKGVGSRYCSIRSTATIITMISITAARCAVENLSIFNLVQSSGGALIYASTAAATQITLTDLDLVGGFYCIEIAGNSTGVFIQNVVARLSTGGALVYLQQAGLVTIEACIFDQDWPVSVPVKANDKATRTNSHAYSVADYVSLGSFILQCAVAGTTAASPPSMTGKWYGQLITDGGVSWYLAGVSGGSSVVIDSQCSYVTLRNVDMTGAFYYGCTINDSLTSGPPDVTVIDTCTVAGIVANGINIVSAKTVWLHKNEIQACIGSSASASGIATGAGFLGELDIKGNRVSAGFIYGVFLGYASGASALVEGNSIFGMSGAGIYAGAAVKDFVITGNNLGSSTYFGANAVAIKVETGASDYYVISKNRVHGATSGVVDGGTGINKDVSANI